MVPSFLQGIPHGNDVDPHYGNATDHKHDGNGQHDDARHDQSQPRRWGITEEQVRRGQHHRDQRLHRAEQNDADVLRDEPTVVERVVFAGPHELTSHVPAPHPEYLPRQQEVHPLSERQATTAGIVDGIGFGHFVHYIVASSLSGSQKRQSVVAFNLSSYPMAFVIQRRCGQVVSLVVDWCRDDIRLVRLERDLRPSLQTR